MSDGLLVDVANSWYLLNASTGEEVNPPADIYIKGGPGLGAAFSLDAGV